MKLKLIVSVIIASGLVAALLALPAAAGDSQKAKDNHAKLEAKAKVSKAEATKIALGKVPNGTVKEVEIEKENGKLIWSFDIATPGTTDITEVQVDAKTGKVLAVETETPAAQAKETEQDARDGNSTKAKDKD